MKEKVSDEEWQQEKKEIRKEKVGEVTYTIAATTTVTSAKIFKYYSKWLKCFPRTVLHSVLLLSVKNVILTKLLVCSEKLWGKLSLGQFFSFLFYDTCTLNVKTIKSIWSSSDRNRTQVHNRSTRLIFHRKGLAEYLDC